MRRLVRRRPGDSEWFAFAPNEDAPALVCDFVKNCPWYLGVAAPPERREKKTAAVEGNNACVTPEPPRGEKVSGVKMRQADICRDLYYLLVETVNAKELAATDPAMSENWVRSMAIASVVYAYPVEIAAYANFSDFLEIWKAGIELARSEPAPEAPENNSSGHRPANLGFELSALFKPLRMMVIGSEIGGLLERYYSSDIVASLMVEIVSFCPAEAKLFDVQDAALRELWEKAEREDAIAEAADEAASRKDPLGRKHLELDVFLEIVESMRPDRGDPSLAALTVRTASRIASLYGLTVDSKKWPSEYDKIWVTARDAKAGPILDCEIEDFMKNVSGLLAPFSCQEILDRHHSHYGVGELFASGHFTTTRELAALYMRLEGYGTLFRKGEDTTGKTRRGIY